MRTHKILALLFTLCYSLFANSQIESSSEFVSTENPIVKYKFTSDPAGLVDGDTLYIFTGHDESAPYLRPQEWLVFSTADMENWIEYPVPLRKTDFAWVLPQEEAWAPHVVKKGDKYYMYVTIGNMMNGKRAIGVAVADTPYGPYKDALGRPLISSFEDNGADIDPAVFVDDDGQAYIFWGLDRCHFAKLKDNMIEIDGRVDLFSIERYTVAPWIHKHNGWYYLSYSGGYPAITAYAMSKSIAGPWAYQEVINEPVENCGSNHHSIVEFKGKSYFIYHNGVLPSGGEGRRSICIDALTYDKAGKINAIEQTPKKQKRTVFGKAI